MNFSLLLLPLWESVIVLRFVVSYFMSILVLQSSWWGRESWLLCLICLPGVSWWLSGSSSRCHGVVCGLWLWYFLIILTYYCWCCQIYATLLLATFHSVTKLCKPLYRALYHSQTQRHMVTKCKQLPHKNFFKFNKFQKRKLWRLEFNFINVINVLSIVTTTMALV